MSIPPGLFSPLSVDSQIRQAVTFCWMMLPKDSQNVATVKSEIARIVDRVMRDFEEDHRMFQGPSTG